MTHTESHLGCQLALANPEVLKLIENISLAPGVINNNMIALSIIFIVKQYAYKQ